MSIEWLQRPSETTEKSMTNYQRLCLLSCVVVSLLASATAAAELRVGAANVNVTPVKLPVLVNGGMLSRTVDKVNTQLSARAIVIDDGDDRIAIVVVDSCMMPRPLLDEAKQLASQRTEIKPASMLISATHTHSAPASMSCLGTNFDPTYVPYLREKLAEAIATAEKNLEPAEVGWGTVDAPGHTALRRWIRRPDRIIEDPFGNPTVRANMHSGRNWDDVVGESGPEDPQLSMISFRSTKGRPIALLCNFSMHYFGDQALSADYFGLFCTQLESEIGAVGGSQGNGDKSDKRVPFLAALSHGCSGDIWRRDYKVAAENRNDAIKIDEFASELADIAKQAYDKIEYSRGDVAMAEARLHLKYRTPDKQRFEWAKRTLEAMGDRLPKTQTEVYAAEALILDERKSTDVVVQAIRIGNIAIATTPNETYALSGLKIKHQSPLEQTMVIELANGGDGYIPPPEQHLFGGYNTWAARSAGLEVMAEPKIVEAAVTLLERTAKSPRRRFRQSRGAASQALLSAKPNAYWRLDEWAGPRAKDSSGNNRDAILEDHVAYFLDGPRSQAFCLHGETNRCIHFVGGRLRTRFEDLGDKYSLSLWFWNGLPTDARSTTGWLASRGNDLGLGAQGDHLGLTGGKTGGALMLRTGAGNNAKTATGSSKIARWTWNHVVLVRDGKQVRVHLNGAKKPEIEIDAPNRAIAALPQLFFGGRCDNDSNWEGRLDEIAVFNRALTADEIAKLAR